MTGSRTASVTVSVLIAGCGDLGLRVAERLHAGKAQAPVAPTFDD